jgi:hypothetical protein
MTTETVMIYFDDLDAMGVVHNGRYVILFERALGAYWTRAGWPYDPGQPRFAEVFFVVRETRSPITCRSPAPALCRYSCGSSILAPRALSTDSGSCRMTGRLYTPRDAAYRYGSIQPHCVLRRSARNYGRRAVRCWHGGKAMPAKSH